MIPTEPGWYWVRTAKSREWEVVPVFVLGRNGLCFRSQYSQLGTQPVDGWDRRSRFVWGPRLEPPVQV